MELALVQNCVPYSAMLMAEAMESCPMATGFGARMPGVAGARQGRYIPLIPFKHNAARRHQIRRARYRVTNWAAYEAGLRRRGDLTFWVEEAAPCGMAGATPQHARRTADQTHCRSGMVCLSAGLGMVA